MHVHTTNMLNHVNNHVHIKYMSNRHMDAYTCSILMCTFDIMFKHMCTFNTGLIHMCMFNNVQYMHVTCDTHAQQS